MYADPSVDAKPALLGQRGGAFYSEAAINLLASLTATAATCRWSTCATTARCPSCPTTPSSRCPRPITAAGATAVPVDAVPPIYSGRSATPHAYEQLALDAAVHGGRDRSSRRCSPTRWWARWTRPRSSPTCCSPPTGSTSAGRSDRPRDDELVLAIDGGNSKTDVVLVDLRRAGPEPRARPGLLPHRLGIDGAVDLLDDMVAKAAAQAGVTRAAAGGHRGSIYLAGVDFPAEEEIATAAVGRAGWARDHVVDNDTFALLRAGTDAPDSASPWSAARGSIRRRLAGRPARTVRLRWAGSPATWAAGWSSATRRCGGPRARPTAAARRPARRPGARVLRPPTSPPSTRRSTSAASSTGG